MAAPPSHHFGAGYLALHMGCPLIICGVAFLWHVSSNPWSSRRWRGHGGPSGVSHCGHLVSGHLRRPQPTQGRRHRAGTGIRAHVPGEGPPALGLLGHHQLLGLLETYIRNLVLVMPGHGSSASMLLSSSGDDASFQISWCSTTGMQHVAACFALWLVCSVWFSLGAAGGGRLGHHGLMGRCHSSCVHHLCQRADRRAVGCPGRMRISC